MNNKESNNVMKSQLHNYILIESEIKHEKDVLNNDYSTFTHEFEEKWNKIELNLQRNKIKTKINGSTLISNNYINLSNNTTCQANRNDEINYFDLPNHYTQKQVGKANNQIIQLSQFIHPFDTSFEEYCIQQIDKFEQMKSSPYRIPINIDEDSDILQYNNPKSIHGLPEYEELSASKQKKKKETNLKTFLMQDQNEQQNKNYVLTFGNKKGAYRKELNNDNEKNKKNDYKYEKQTTIFLNENKLNHKMIRNKDKQMDYFDQTLQDNRKDKKHKTVNNNTSKVIQKIEDNKKLLNFLFKVNKI